MDDKTLIEKIHDGDLSAIRILIQQNKNLIWHIIISMTGHHSDCEDMFQEICLRVIKGIKYFRSDSRLSTWIGSISHHVCVDYLRKRKKEREYRNEESDHLLPVLNLSDKSWQQAENNDLKKLILSAISELPADYRTVITLYHLDECSYRDISEITGMPEGTVKSYISRGRIRLKEILTTLIPDLADIRSEL